MKKSIITATCLILASLTSIAQELKTFNDSLSYAIGVLYGNDLNKRSITDLEMPLLTKGMSDITAGKNPLISPTLASQLFNQWMQNQKKIKGKKAREEGEAFLKANAEKEGVVTLESGLQYQILKQGDGPIPKSTDKVKVHYEGTLLNGEVIDSSIQRGEPATFPVTGVIKGWVEALQLMPVGSKWKLFIPYHLAYGERGAPPKIKPFDTLIFEVELLGIEK